MFPGLFSGSAVLVVLGSVGLEGVDFIFSVALLQIRVFHGPQPKAKPQGCDVLFPVGEKFTCERELL